MGDRRRPNSQLGYAVAAAGWRSLGGLAITGLSVEETWSSVVKNKSLAGSDLGRRERALLGTCWSSWPRTSWQPDVLKDADRRRRLTKVALLQRQRKRGIASL